MFPYRHVAVWRGSDTVYITLEKAAGFYVVVLLGKLHFYEPFDVQH